MGRALESAIISLANAFVQSQLDYHNFDTMTAKASMKELQTIQNCIAGGALLECMCTITLDLFVINYKTLQNDQQY